MSDNESYDIESFLEELWEDDHDPSNQSWEAHVLDRLSEASALLDEHGHHDLAEEVAGAYQKVGEATHDC